MKYALKVLKTFALILQTSLRHKTLLEILPGWQLECWAPGSQQCNKLLCIISQVLNSAKDPGLQKAEKPREIVFTSQEPPGFKEMINKNQKGVSSPASMFVAWHS